MQLVYDSLYNAADPSATPCRWFITIRDCQDSMFFGIFMWISLTLAFITVVAGGTLTIILGRREGKIFEPSKWPTYRLAAMATLLVSSFQVISATLFLIDPPISASLRMFFFFTPYTMGFLSLAPYFTSLISTGIFGTSTSCRRLPYHTLLRSTILIVPLGMISGIILDTISGHYLEVGKENVSDWYITIAFSVVAFASAFVFVCCSFGGHATAKVVEDHVMHTINISPHPTIAAYIKENAHLADECPQSNTYECALRAHIVLERMRHLHKSTCVSSSITGICYIIIAILPTEFYRIPALSKVVFLLLLAAVMIRPFLTSIIFLYAEIRTSQTDTRVFDEIPIAVLMAANTIVQEEAKSSSISSDSPIVMAIK